MDLKDLDLNLLVVFNELQKHGRVAAVAQSLGISQPGVSNAGPAAQAAGRRAVPAHRARHGAHALRAIAGPAHRRRAGALHSTLNARASFDPRGSSAAS